MQPLCIGVADFTCTEVRVAVARQYVLIANRRVGKRDCVPRMFLFISHITTQFLVENMSPDLLPGQPRNRGTEEQTVSDR